MNAPRPIVLLTRAQSQSARIAAMLPDAGVVISPIQSVERLEAQIPDGDVILTSENAVMAASEALKDRRAWCVGQRTADAARGFGADAIDAGGDANALLALLKKTMPQGAIYLRGVQISRDLVAEAAAFGLNLQQRTIYKINTVPLTLQANAALIGTAPVILPIFSQASAERLSSNLPKNTTAPLILVGISDAALADWKGPTPIARTIAKSPDAQAMVKAIMSHLG